LKVIVKSKVPFIVVQDPPATRRDIKIVFPVDFKNRKAKKNADGNLPWASILDSKINILVATTTDQKYSQENKCKQGFCHQVFHPE